MRVRQIELPSLAQASEITHALRDFEPHLLLSFGHLSLVEQPELPRLLKATAPKAISIGCSTAGAISSGGIADQSVVVTAIRFNKPDLAVASTKVTGMQDSEMAGQRIGSALLERHPHTVLMLGQGVDLNGSALIRGLRRVLGPNVTLIGGLANDGVDFRKTVVFLDESSGENQLVGIGFCDPGLTVTHGSVGGWRPFGPVRRVTRAMGNVLYELDGESALSVYKRYLGSEATNLPGSALLFPFSMLDHAGQETGITRTILGIDELNGCITLAGEIVEQGYLRLMCATHDDLITGAEMAAEAARADDKDNRNTSFALLVSCIGRLMSLGERTEEEVDAVAAILGPHCLLSGFYSNGEISARASTPENQLNNQTMTVTRFGEAA